MKRQQSPSQNAWADWAVRGGLGSLLVSSYANGVCRLGCPLLGAGRAAFELLPWAIRAGWQIFQEHGTTVWMAEGVLEHAACLTRLIGRFTGLV